MANWVDKCFDLIVSGNKPHILLNDPDSLIKYRELTDRIEDEGIVVFRAETDLEVRLIFELEVRRSSNRCLLVLPQGYTPQPDMLAISEPVTIKLSQLFPNLDTSVLHEVEHDLLFKLYNVRLYSKLSREETIELILKQSSRDELDRLPELLRTRFEQRIDQANDERLEQLLENLSGELDTAIETPERWLILVNEIAEARLRAINSSDENLRESYRQIEDDLNTQFQDFLDQKYSDLFSLSGIRRPVVVSKILDNINARKEAKAALIVLDGMNYWQWLVISGNLRDSGIRFHAKGTMSYIPSITAWSRQSIFRGAEPDLNENNSKEAELFTKYWEGKGVNPRNILFRKFGVSENVSTSEIADTIKVLGLVCNDLDEIMHGTTMGDAQLLRSTLQWVDEIGIAEIIRALQVKGFKIFIATDHGNLEAKGTGSLKGRDKISSVSRGKRFIDFPNETLQRSFLEQNQGLNVGVNGLSVYLRDRSAFTIADDKVITHGGSHIFEVLIPYIEIENNE